MAEKGQTSSMTSVTEEDSSADSESDTTESSYSLVTSSVLSSSDYNTDDKLTPGLVSISISKTPTRDALKQGKSKLGIGNVTEGYFGCKRESTKECSNKDLKTISQAAVELPVAPLFPYGSNPLPLRKASADNSYKNSQKLWTYCDRERCVENLGVDDPENRLSTDFSDTSSICKDPDKTLTNDNTVQDSVDIDSSNGASNSENSSRGSKQKSDERPHLPDLSSATWYQAQCFDRYWSNYRFVMDWYQLHLKTVQKLSGFKMGVGAAANVSHQGRRQQSSNRARKARRSRRARNRRLAKERQRVGSADNVASHGDNSRTETAVSGSSRPSDEEMKMEITDEMVEFFTTSYKHKMERDTKKKMEGKSEEEDAHVNIDQVVSGQQAPSTSAPAEQPGLRRTAELKYLYGTDAPMIHGMETALQLTFDRVSDKCQPKLWPNMPLKINFA
ncbi:uncharacterized protein LOC101864458 [Aplysia californica]|uniref:Uncharacterized protein LOC101864458 n=1 Tax=Aplysia californica TaxID=6500 RepID=A0ABM1VSQ3_APLCA|nr:uncharacterized protein LOC101864458 [Aplysia californica]